LCFDTAAIVTVDPKPQPAQCVCIGNAMAIQWKADRIEGIQFHGPHPVGSSARGFGQCRYDSNLGSAALAHAPGPRGDVTTV
jgi:hypothetical protein